MICVNCDRLMVQHDLKDRYFVCLGCEARVKE